MTHKLTPSLIAVEVPEGSYNHMIHFNKTFECWHNFNEESEGHEDYFVDLPPGSYTPIGLLSDVTEEQAVGLVEIYDDEHECCIWYKDYFNTGYGVDTALASLHSLVRSQGMNPDQTVILYEPKK